MTDFLLRNLDEHLLAHLKERARDRGRSLQAELRRIIETAVSELDVDPVELAAGVRERLKGREHRDSAASIAEDRLR